MLQLSCQRCTHTGNVTKHEVRQGIMHLWCPACGAGHVLLPTGTTALLPDEAAAPARAPLAAAAPTVQPLPIAQAPALAVAPVLDQLELEPIDEVGELPPVKCPKCAHRQHDTEACEKCGLVFAMLRPGTTPWENYPPSVQPFVPRARQMWAELEASPADESAHDAFLTFCRSKGLILFAVTRYRHRVADHPRDAVAKRFLERASNDAVAMVATMQSGRVDFMEQAHNVRRWMLVVAAILATIAVILVIKVAIAPTGSPLP